MAPVLVSSFLWLEKESVEGDNELDKPDKPSWGLTCQLVACCHHCHELGRAGECPDQPVPKVTTKIVHGEVEAHGQREVRGGRGERVINRVLPCKAGCRFS